MMRSEIVDGLAASGKKEQEVDATYLITPEEDVGPIAMSPVGKTLDFPRRDNIFTHKESLPFDEAHSKIWTDRPRRRKNEHCKEWVAYGLIGVVVGTVAFLMTLFEEKAADYINERI